MPAVRLSDVAEAAGVSLATASRVLNGSDRVPGEKVARKVRSAADRLGYVTNAQAQALARSRSGLIGLVVHDIADPYFASIASRIQQRAFASSAQVLLTQTGRDPKLEERAIRSLIAQRVDSLVLVGTHRYGDDSDTSIRALLSGFERHGGQVVGLGQSLGVGRTIATDSAEASHELATALIVDGHRRFALPASIPGVPSATDRVGAFRAALTEAGLEAELDAPASLDREGGHRLGQAVAEHVRADSPADAPLCVFAPADVMALGLMGELHREGIAVPEQVAVAGFGGTPDAADAYPALTTVALPLQRMGDQALAWILGSPTGEADHASPQDSPREIRMRGEVLLRESTRITPAG